MDAGEDAVRTTTPQSLLGVQQRKESLNHVIHEQDQTPGLSIGCACSCRRRGRDGCGCCLDRRLIGGRRCLRPAAAGVGLRMPAPGRRTTTTSRTRAPRLSRRSTRRTSPSLKVKWRFAIKGASAFGAIATSPIVINGTVYFQDLNSNVYALDRATGKLEWEHKFNKPDEGPNGVSYGYGRLYGATSTDAFALDPADRKADLDTQAAPQQERGHRHDASAVRQHGRSSAPCRATPRRSTPATGTASSGRSTPPRARRSGSSTRSPTAPSCSAIPRSTAAAASGTRPRSTARVASSSPIANPGPLYGTPKFPGGSSRPGPNLYTNSIVALNGQTGKLLWYRQAVPHDVRDYDLMIPAI